MCAIHEEGILHNINYFGVAVGNITADEVFAKPWASAKWRACMVANMHLSLLEHVPLFKNLDFAHKFCLQQGPISVHISFWPHKHHRKYGFKT